MHLLSVQTSNSNLSKVFNVLLIGKEDHPKSVAINAIANYLRFDSFADVSATTTTINDLSHIIPVKVNFFNRDKFEHTIISFGKSEGNINESASTATLKCHILRYGDRVIRLIDTPESESESQYVSILKQFDTIDGICCFFSTRNERNDNKNLLNNLIPLLNDFTRSSFRNIIFCFTYINRPNYNIDKFKKSINKELKPFGFELKNGENCFHIDCEPFQMLLANKLSNHEFTDENEKYWNKSQESVRQMMDKIINTEAYSLKEYFIIKQRDDFYSEIEKSETTFNEDIDSKLNAIQDDANRVKSFTNKHRNLEVCSQILNKIKSEPDEIEYLIKQLVKLRELTLNYFEFIFAKSNHSNQNPMDLINPFILDFLYYGSQEKNSKNKQLKNSAKITEISENEKLQHLLKSFKYSVESTGNSDQVEDLCAKFSLLENFGQQYIQNFIKQTLDSVKPVMDTAKQVVEVFQKCSKQIDNLTKCNQEIRDSNKIRLVGIVLDPKNNFVYPYCFEECDCNPEYVNFSDILNAEMCDNIAADYKCQNCLLNWEEHRHMSSSQFQEYNEEVIIVLKKEMKTSKNVASKLDYLLLKNPQTTFDNFIEHRLNESPISTESQVNNDSANEHLNRFKNNHWKNVLKNIDGNAIIDVKDILKIQNELLGLRWCGNSFDFTKE